VPDLYGHCDHCDPSSEGWKAPCTATCTVPLCVGFTGGDTDAFVVPVEAVRIAHRLSSGRGKSYDATRLVV